MVVSAYCILMGCSSCPPRGISGRWVFHGMQVWFGIRRPNFLGKSYAHDRKGVRKQVRRKGTWPCWRSDTRLTIVWVPLAHLIYRACPVTSWICWSVCICAVRRMKTCRLKGEGLIWKVRDLVCGNIR